MQWQHGTYTKHANGSLTLVPIAVDGRQLYSDPCTYKNSIYTRYNTSEMFKVNYYLFRVGQTGANSMQWYEVIEDSYHNIPRLNLYKHDGSPLQPLYLAMSPPQMLPTSTLNPIVTATADANPSAKVRRGELPHRLLAKRSPEMKNADTWWWFGVFMTAGGGVMYFLF